MGNNAGDTVRVGEATARSLLRGIGRAALWALVALLLVRGAADVLSEPRQVEPAPTGAGAAGDPATGAFAVRFARAYLAGASPRDLAPLLAPGAPVRATGPAGEGARVAQAEVAGVRDLGGGRAIVTVACELGDARTLYLAVPIVREDAGEVAALGAPAVVAGPAAVRGRVERPRPLAGPDGAAIADLARRFLGAYLSASGPGDLSYLLAPGASVTPPGGGLRLLAIHSVGQEGAGEGPRRTVVVAARVRDTASGATYPLAYRLEVVRRGRWYVQAVQGALS